MESPLPKLGKLAQNARQKHLKSARSCLFVVAALQFIGGIIFTFLIMNQPIPPAALPMVYLGLGIVFGRGYCLPCAWDACSEVPYPCHGNSSGLIYYSSCS